MNRWFVSLLEITLTISFFAWTGCQPAQEPGDDAASDSLAAADTAAPASLYERLGGEPAITAVVDTFVSMAAADAELNFTRQGTANEWEATPASIDTLKTRLVQFVGQATGGPQIYEGQDMGTVHEGMSISNEEFDRLGGHLLAALDAYSVPAPEQEELMAIVETTRSAIVAADTTAL